MVLLNEILRVITNANSFQQHFFLKMVQTKFNLELDQFYILRFVAWSGNNAKSRSEVTQ